LKTHDAAQGASFKVNWPIMESHNGRHDARASQ
jgi:hypothetical protein